MLFFLISCLSFLLLSQSLSPQPLRSWLRKCAANEMTPLLIWFWQELSRFLVQWLRYTNFVFGFSPVMLTKKKSPSKAENVEETEDMSVIDLPELVLESILGRLSPAGLCNVAGVCSSLRDRCRSNHLWEHHLREKWGRVIGEAAYREWQLFVAERKDSGGLDAGKSKGLMGSLSCIWSLSWLRSKLEGGRKPKSSLPIDSIMNWYLSLESGKFWFPAQVYNREHGHVGFMLSCYDAELCYNCISDTFRARYPPHGRRTIVIEEGVQWERLRAPPVSTPAHDLHVSDCLNNLHPGVHVEIQWRRNKEFPYGWWYGVVGHLDSCDRSKHHCRCHTNDTIMLEFNQYTPGSRWRRTAINRKNHQEEGNEADGFYGGIRRLQSKEEISTWKRLWPKEVLE